MTIIAFENKYLREYYDSIVKGLLDIEYLNDNIDKGEKVLLIYDRFDNNVGKYYDGLESVFKIDGLLMIINDYLTRNKIGMRACKDIYGDMRLNVIKIEKFIRLEHISVEKRKKDFCCSVSTIGDKIVEINKEEQESRTKKIIEERKLIKEG